ncbi:hypothetical protein [Telluria aromaticivorans]|uniref:Uncharacterized protein n=1 Tax=Telluria aromaticivorans TaxID=2725995 RepID=A0A7Y2JYP1_9BURK|nr:hypothetical protein [Telluria aromaticivorans]NNG23407.1 hypothetical protein [Telluria aromaticivorans]
MANTRTAVNSLPVALALISAAHRTAVLAHPQWIDMARDPDPARQLAWMVEQGLLTYDELDDLQTFDPESSEQDRIVEEAYAMLGQYNALANCGLLHHLCP